MTTKLLDIQHVSGLRFFIRQKSGGLRMTIMNILQNYSLNKIKGVKEMIEKTVSHDPAFRDPAKRDKFFEKLGSKTVERSVKMISVSQIKKMT